MPVLKLSEIDEMREAAAAKCAYKNQVPPYAMPEIKEEVRNHIAGLEWAIDKALVARFKCPVCPFCRGAVVQTPTQGRLGCVDCGAIMLRGGGEAVIHGGS